MWTVKEVPAYRKIMKSSFSGQSNVLEFFWRWRPHYPLKCRYQLTTPQDAIAQKKQKTISTSVTVSDITSFKHFLPSLSSWQIRLPLHATKDKFNSNVIITRNIIEILKMFAYLNMYAYIKRRIVVCMFLDCNKLHFHSYSINECLRCSLDYNHACYGSFKDSTMLSFVTQK